MSLADQLKSALGEAKGRVTGVQLKAWFKKNVPFSVKCKTERMEIVCSADAGKDLAQYADKLGKAFDVEVLAYGQKSWLTVLPWKPYKKTG